MKISTAVSPSLYRGKNTSFISDSLSSIKAVSEDKIIFLKRTQSTEKED